VRVVVLFNPNSGRGRGKRTAETVRLMLEDWGAEVSLFATAKEPRDAFRERLGGALAGANLLIVAGGDGTLHHTLPAVVGSSVAVYHLAMGTENLFAREFGMDGDPKTLARALDRGRVDGVDVGMLRVNGDDAPTPFVLMCSVGPDASVIRRMDRVRKGPISHLSYLKPIAAELMNTSLPRFTIEVDGRRVVEHRVGLVVVANSRQYAWRIDPAHRASMSDGLLDVVFLPCERGVVALASLLKSKSGKPDEAMVYEQGRSIRVRAEHPDHPAVQVDGEHSPAEEGPLDLRLDVQPAGLRVLVP
jgi:diacylglycerol kinase family enzyme